MYVIGHISIDKIVDPDGNIAMSAGGAPTYCGFYLSQLDIRIAPVSVVGPDFDGLRQYEERGLSIDGIRVEPTCKTTSYELKYRRGDGRELRLASRCRDFRVDDVNGVRGTAVVNPIAGEVSLDLLKLVRNSSDFMAIDAQGFSRRFDVNGNVSVSLDHATLNSLLVNGDLLKLSVDDVDDLDLVKLSKNDKYVLVTMGSRLGYLIHNGRRYGFKQTPPVSVVDPTGAGDVTGCALAWHLSRGEDAAWSFARAMAISMEKVRHLGPYGVMDSRSIDELTDLLLDLLVIA